MNDINQQKVGAATIMFLGHYLIACFSVGVTYGVGRLASWAFG